MKRIIKSSDCYHWGRGQDESVLRQQVSQQAPQLGLVWVARNVSP